MICHINKIKLLKFKEGATPIIERYVFRNYDELIEVLTFKEFQKLFRIVVASKRNIILRITLTDENRSFDTPITPQVIEQNKHSIPI